ncbi:MAG TPA: malto-oligosyltrehalose synthase [Acetobacteraceae bacterium]|nr:malto-oligosyltrehalose synthase [Acetobacteraceae bacterium]
MTAPRATMRLQLHRDFTFADATKLVPYLAALGISHLYSSPILAARAGSMHGYDVTDPTRVNPELGSEAGLRSLVAALRAAGLGLIVDIVPNHMAAGGMENPWWADVLRHGRASRYATFFDIDWDVPGKVLAPFLGQPYGEALRDGTITLVRDHDSPVIRYFDTLFPIRPEDHPKIAEAPTDAFDPATQQGRARLHRLLEHQHYRLAWWHSAGDATNWRRFFDINGLVGLRVEDETVFDATHATLLLLYEQGLIDGVRVDHVDGLADPPGYCRRLRARLDALAGQRPADAPQGPAWFVVEKILGAGERLPGDWAVDGTSGYDFMDDVSALLHDGSGETELRSLWGDLSGRPLNFDEEEIAARRDVLEHAFTAQLDGVVAALHRIAVRCVETRDTTPAAIRRALVALLARFPVYRSYGVGRRSDVVAQAVADAMKKVPAAYHPTLALLERWLGDDATPEAAVRFQQLSAPLAAKAVEDTAYYRYGVLLSRNEVGADVRRFSATVQEFHGACLARRQHFPDAMLTTATHDHKRGEDVRARLAVLSEIPDEWERTVRHWFALNTPHRRHGDGPMPSAGDEAMLYQMIVGAWPVDAVDVRDYTERLAEWQLKALREAKLVTDWEAPNLDYEDAARSFLYTIMADRRFVAEAGELARQIGPASAVNGLTQTLLKLTVPGVPDFYQGTEFWDQSLVDPDNRQPVDFARRIEALKADAAPAALAAHWQDGKVKQAVIHRALGLRSEAPDLFGRGEYRPVEVTGPLSAHVVASVRSHADAHCIVVVPRLMSRFTPRPLAGEVISTIVIPAKIWHRTILHLPDDLLGRPVRDRISDSRLGPLAQCMPLETILAYFPVALLATE